MEHIQFAVQRSTTPDRDVRMAGVLEPAVGTEADVGITLDRQGEGAESHVEVRLDLPSQSYRFVFPPVQDLSALRHRTRECEQTLDEFELVWERIDELLQLEVEAGHRVAVDVPRPAEVEYAYVLSIIDLVLGTGAHAIDFPAQSLGIVFGEHKDADPLDPVSTTDEDFPLWLGVLVALLAFGLPLLGLWTRKRHLQ